MADVTTNAGEVAAELLGAGVRATAAVYGVVRTYGVRLEAKVKANASGRPGPRAQTGDYRRSINVQVGRTGTRFEARVSTNKPQGPRLEYGFVGEDALGRTYNQPPYPHFGPALDQVGPGFEAAVAAVAAGVLAGDELGPSGPAPRARDERSRFIGG